MGSAASVAVPDNISFADLLRLVPLITQGSADCAINIDELQKYFKTNRNENGFLAKQKFIDLVLTFSEKPELRDSILTHQLHTANDTTLEEVTEIHRFRGNDLYNQVYLVDYEVFKNHGSYPCFSEPIVPSVRHADKVRFDLAIPVDQINFESAYVIFISHTWFQRNADGCDSGSVDLLDSNAAMKMGLTHPDLKVHIPAHEAAKNVHINTHPDTEHNDQYRICLSGLQKFKTAHLTNFEKVYLWMDYCCLDLRPGHVEETLNTLSLSSIMSCCDCVFTPLYDPNMDWEFPAEIVHFYEDYNPAPFSTGPDAYLNRAWCRMEALFANNVPIMKDLTHEDIVTYLQRHHCVIHEGSVSEAEILKRKMGATAVTDLVDNKHLRSHKNPFANVNVKVLDPHNHSRRVRLSPRLRVRANSEQRPHIFYGSYEYRLGLPPLIVSPLSNLYINKYAPLEGNVSRLDDISEYKPAVTSPDPEKAHMRTPGDSAGVAGSGAYTPAKYCEARNNLDNTKYTVAKKAAPVLQKRDTPSVLHRLFAELTALIKKGKLGYDGEMNEDGERHGRGIYTYANGEKYIGEWEHGKRQGMGLLQHANGDVYNGEFHQDREQGLCTLRYSSGDNYFGEMHHGRRTGHGLMEYASGDMYEGDFDHDKRCGEGVLKYTSGQVYTGFFKDDARHGFGVLSDANTRTVLYHGFWQHDEQAPDYKPPGGGETGNDGSADGEDGNGHHHHHHKHHHHHHKHHHHHHHHHDKHSSEDGDIEGTEDGDDESGHRHRKHRHKHSPTPDANGEFSSTPLDGEASPLRSESPAKLTLFESAEKELKSPKSQQREAAREREAKKARIKSLYDAQKSSGKTIDKILADVEAAHLESVSVKLSPELRAKKKKLPAKSVEQSASLPALPAAGVEGKNEHNATAGEKHPTGNKDDKQHKKHDSKGGKGAHTKKHH